MKVFKIILFIFLFFVILAGIGVLVIYNLTLPPKGDLIEYKLNVPSGVSYRSISEELEENNIIKNSKLFYLYSTHQHIVLAGTQVVHDADALQCGHIAVDIGCLDAVLRQIVAGAF